MKTAVSRLIIIRRPAAAPRRARQRGISLFVILIVVMLSMLLAVWASRTSLFQEMVVGNDADYQRAFEAAQAMIQDAEFDIRGEVPDGSGALCDLGAGPVGAEVCRANDARTSPLHYPAETADINKLLDYLATNSPATGCMKGLCRKFNFTIGGVNGVQNFWDNPSTFSDMTAVGARFGTYTGATAEGGDKYFAATATILNNRDDGQGAWYWIEVLPFDSSSENQRLIVNSGQGTVPLYVKPAAAYRITAVALGRKPGSRVVMQETYVRQRVRD